MPQESDEDGTIATSQGYETSEVGELDSDDEYKICAVCGDKATGYHFNAMTCEGCKGFFRRTMKKTISFTCPFNQNCDITKNNRRQCQACRLQKCLQVGMRKELIMSDEAVVMRRTLMKKRKQERSLKALKMKQEGLTADQEKLPATETPASVLRYSGDLDMLSDPTAQVFDREGAFALSMDPQSTKPIDYLEEGYYQPVFPMLAHLSKFNTYLIQQMIKFAKEIPGFRDLLIDDQIALLKGATFEVATIEYNTLFNPETESWSCGPYTYKINDATIMGFPQSFLESLLRFHINLQKLELHKAECVLLEALSIFSPDRPGVTKRDIIDQIQEKLAITLKTYIDYKHPFPQRRFLYAKLLSLLTEIRSLNEEHGKQIVRIQQNRNFSNFISPLVKEIFSQSPQVPQ
ncbi:nuclear receptor subfamily 1 group I member 3 isoform X2 [Latimeria chalumnae]|uniref:nuclear receptor subfamily 1 group I member 3 isoform X2 n=1 Tax=Latimeria chalumnae TaxID=7897 RepID=UPI00313F3369